MLRVVKSNLIQHRNCFHHFQSETEYQGFQEGLYALAVLSQQLMGSSSNQDAPSHTQMQGLSILLLFPRHQNRFHHFYSKTESQDFQDGLYALAILPDLVEDGNSEHSTPPRLCMVAPSLVSVPSVPCKY